MSLTLAGPSFMSSGIRPPLSYPKRWNATKFISWPPSLAKPMVHVPLPRGRYISKSVTSVVDEIETIVRPRPS